MMHRNAAAGLFLVLMMAVGANALVNRAHSSDLREKTVKLAAQDRALKAVQASTRTLAAKADRRSTANTRFLQGKQGRPGVAGRGGVLGAVGPAGSLGGRGEPGRTVIGPQGLAGGVGHAGPDGPAGADGVPGEPGASGEPGTNGKDGANGKDGTDGAAGPAFDPTGRTLACQPTDDPFDPPDHTTCVFNP